MRARRRLSDQAIGIFRSSLIRCSFGFEPGVSGLEYPFVGGDAVFRLDRGSGSSGSMQRKRPTCRLNDVLGNLGSGELVDGAPRRQAGSRPPAHRRAWPSSLDLPVSPNLASLRADAGLETTCASECEVTMVMRSRIQQKAREVAHSVEELLSKCRSRLTTPTQELLRRCCPFHKPDCSE